MVKLPSLEEPTNVYHRVHRAYEFPSKSRTGKKHFTLVFDKYSEYDRDLNALTVEANIGIDCSCEGWQLNDHCWHVDYVKQELNL